MSDSFKNFNDNKMSSSSSSSHYDDGLNLLSKLNSGLSAKYLSNLQNNNNNSSSNDYLELIKANESSLSKRMNQPLDLIDMKSLNHQGAGSFNLDVDSILSFNKNNNSNFINGNNMNGNSNSNSNNNLAYRHLTDNFSQLQLNNNSSSSSNLKSNNNNNNNNNRNDSIFQKNYATASSNLNDLFYSSSSNSNSHSDFGALQQQQTKRTNGNNGNSDENNFDSNNGGKSSSTRREVGYIEKLVNSYGFLKCLDRDGRLFFHLSSFLSNGNNGSSSSSSTTSSDNAGLKVGDYVEFEEAIDKRNGKPIAVNVCKYPFDENVTFNSTNIKPVNSNSNSNSNISNLNSNNNNNNNNNGNESHLMQQQLKIDSSLNLSNLKELLKNSSMSFNGNSNNSDNGNYQFANSYDNNNGNSNGSAEQQQQQHYAKGQPKFGLNEMSEMLGMENNAANNFNSILRLFNKDFNSDSSSSSSSAYHQHHLNANNHNIHGNSNSNALNSNFVNMIQSALTTQKTATANAYHEQFDGEVALVSSGFNPKNNGGNGRLLFDGRISCSLNNELVYVPYSYVDVIGEYELKMGDRVKFYLAKEQTHPLMQNSGTLYAHRIELANNFLIDQYQQQEPRKLYRGIIKILKDSFGKIEREDAFKETFFHITEYKGNNPEKDLRIGVNVEFEIQDRLGKENACNISVLPAGTVTFDDISQKVYIGRIIQAPSISNNLFGRLIFDNNEENLVELTFGLDDRVSGDNSYTLLEGDFVQFRIAVDKRIKNMSNSNPGISLNLSRATQVTLIQEHDLTENSVNTKEKRIRGVIIKLFVISPDGKQYVDLKNSEMMPNFQSKYGAIQMVDNNSMIYFPLEEFIKYVRFDDESTVCTVNDVSLELGDSVEFSVIACQKDAIFSNGFRAIRIRKIPITVGEQKVVSKETYTGIVTREALNDSSDDNQASTSKGVIKYETQSDASESIDYYFCDLSEPIMLFAGDQVEFNICKNRTSKKVYAINVQIVEPKTEKGFISMLNEKIGCIELDYASSIAIDTSAESKDNEDLNKFQREFYFNFSDLKNPVGELEIGDEMEFTVTRKDLRNLMAENVKKATTSTNKVSLNSTMYRGTIVEELKLTKNAAEPKRDSSYYGKVKIIATVNENSKKDGSGPNPDMDQVFKFGVFSLARDVKASQLKSGTSVLLQLGTSGESNEKLPFNMKVNKQENAKRGDVKKGKIESIKGHCGFIEFSQGDNSKKLFFHMSDLENSSDFLKVGDEVEFQLSHNSRSGKMSAIKLKKLSSAKPASNKSATNNSAQPNGANANDPENKRPDRLVTKLKVANIDNVSGKQLILVRQPANPDGKQVSFSRTLKKRQPGQTVLEESETPIRTSESSDRLVDEEQQS